MRLATGGFWRGGTPEWITGIGTDTRSFRDGDAFLALRGPRFDGHRCALDVAAKASALIGDCAGAEHWRNIALPQLCVSDSLRALGDLAHAWRNKLVPGGVLAVSGSYGKTSVRTMLHQVFRALGRRVHATKGNLNNLIGVPLSLLDAPRDSELVIIECGISEQGEMARLAQIVAPDVVVLTGIAYAHGAGLGGLAAITREKARLLQALSGYGWCALGMGVRQRLQDAGVSLPRHAIVSETSDAVGWRLTANRLRLSWRAQMAELELPLPARHVAANMALVATVVLHWHLRQQISPPRLSQIAAALAAWQPPQGRMRVLEACGWSIIDDSYNANPASMQAALDTLAALSGYRVAILGDMAELGGEAHAWHAHLNLHDIDELILVGSHMRVLSTRHRNAHWFADVTAAAAFLADHRFPPESHILLKASRGVGLERLLPALTRQGVAGAV